MGQSSHRLRSIGPVVQPDVAPTDGVGSVLLEACKARFAPPESDVACDAARTVWVRRAGTTRSIGLQPWSLRDHSLDELLRRVGAKLELPVAGG